jgi:hypothetical protein
LAIQDYSPKENWFSYASGGNKRKKTVSNCLRNKKRFVLFPNRKDHIYYRCYQIKQKIFIIGNSRLYFIRGLKARNAISDFYERFFVFLKTSMGWAEGEPCSFSLFS